MKEIKYYNKILKFDDEGNEIYEIVELKYPCKDNKFEYWLDIITKTYGEYGEISYKDIEDIKTKEELAMEELIKIKEQLSATQKAIDFLIINGGM